MQNTPVACRLNIGEPCQLFSVGYVKYTACGMYILELLCFDAISVLLLTFTPRHLPVRNLLWFWLCLSSFIIRTLRLLPDLCDFWFQHSTKRACKRKQWRFWNSWQSTLWWRTVLMMLATTSGNWPCSVLTLLDVSVLPTMLTGLNGIVHGNPLF